MRPLNVVSTCVLLLPALPAVNVGAPIQSVKPPPFTFDGNLAGIE